MTPPRRPRSGRELKDKVLQARIPGHLDQELRRRASRLGISVSTVVRNVLLHTFDLVEGVVTDSTEVARSLGQAPPPSSERAQAEAGRGAVVLGWHEVTLNVNALCERCNAILAKGTSGAIGVPVSARPAFLCLTCLQSIDEARDPPDGGRAADRSPEPRRRRSRRASR